jgi:transcriptional regulator with XRE-family HTH domain
MTLQAKLVGALLRQARLAAGKNVDDIAELLGTTSSSVAAYERGSKAISLPELELFAFQLGIPLRRFLAPQQEEALRGEALDAEEALPPRQRSIGARIKAERDQLGMSARELAQATNLPVGRLLSYERGERPIPLPELDVIGAALGRSMEDFVESEGPIGEWDAGQRAFEFFLRLPADLRGFLTQPGHLPYLRLAQRLSEMSIDRIRNLAEALLDITV